MTLLWRPNLYQDLSLYDLEPPGVTLAQSETVLKFYNLEAWCNKKQTHRLWQTRAVTWQWRPSLNQGLSLYDLEPPGVTLAQSETVLKFYNLEARCDNKLTHRLWQTQAVTLLWRPSLYQDLSLYDLEPPGVTLAQSETVLKFYNLEARCDNKLTHHLWQTRAVTLLWRPSLYQDLSLYDLEPPGVTLAQSETVLKFYNFEARCDNKQTHRLWQIRAVTWQWRPSLYQGLSLYDLEPPGVTLAQSETVLKFYNLEARCDNKLTHHLWQTRAVTLLWRPSLYQDLSLYDLEPPGVMLAQSETVLKFYNLEARCDNKLTHHLWQTRAVTLLWRPSLYQDLTLYDLEPPGVTLAQSETVLKFYNLEARCDKKLTHHLWQTRAVTLLWRPSLYQDLSLYDLEPPGAKLVQSEEGTSISELSEIQQTPIDYCKVKPV